MIEESHRFGSGHTRLKLEIIGAYLPAYTKALKNLPFTLHYIDAFAGTGDCEIMIDGESITVPGSASLAIACQPPFHKLLFIEKSRKRVKALERRLSGATGDISVVRGDANQVLPEALAAMSIRRDRAIVFLDPYGMQLHWTTLQTVAKGQFADVWYLFPLSGLYRQATRIEANITGDKAAALTRIFGTEDWRSAFYPERKDLFGKVPGVRSLGVPEMLDWVKARLETIFPRVTEPKLLYRKTKVGTRVPIFALFFAISNRSPRAIDLAVRIAGAVLKKEWETGPK